MAIDIPLKFLDTASEFLFGEAMGVLHKEVPTKTQNFISAYRYGGRGINVRVRLGKMRFLYRDRKWQEAIQTSHTFLEKYVQAALAFRRRFLAEESKNGDSADEDRESAEPYILLHEMAKETDRPEELRNQILHIFLAGNASSAITVSNALFHLSRHPRVWKILRTEVLSAGPNSLTFESLRNLQYLQYIIKETLRLNPIAPEWSRYVYKDTILPTGGGPLGTAPILVEKGSIVITNFYALHRLIPCFAENEPDRFLPERWEKLILPPFAYQPFGAGPRMCPAQPLALTEVAYVLARMAQEFMYLENRDACMEWVEELTVTASSRNGTLVGLVTA